VTVLPPDTAYPFLPSVDFPTLRGFWEAARRSRLAFPFCTECRRWSWYPGWDCAGCGGPLEWQEVSTMATVVSWTTVEHAFHPAFRPLLPFRVALVEPSEAPGVRLVVRLDEASPNSDIGDAVRIGFVKINEDLSIPVAHGVTNEPIDAGNAH
jgi:uncharacterized OB-fold protein